MTSQQLPNHTRVKKSPLLHLFSQLKAYNPTSLRYSCFLHGRKQEVLHSDSGAPPGVEAVKLLHIILL